ncbi:hypothetical protein [Lewinella sp. IMCC34183]|uniref:hypothetical protein n=1 Tax=Lewinella sp. IMCC34183 TaxID=2248762 RepID=UPI000E25FFF6|nr:hypothetical protein [Lewinella sp. IMCC34183]
MVLPLRDRYVLLERTVNGRKQYIDDDGICNDKDRYPGSDDTADADGDTLPGGCDDRPNVFDGVQVYAACFGDLSPLRLIRGGRDATGRFTFTNAATGLKIAFNTATSTWDLTDIASTSPQVYFGYPLATTPNPPASELSA